MRDNAIDTGRGLLVLAMIYGHVLQFFGASDIFPVIGTTVNVINLLVFPTFVFFFGRTAALAYLKKDYRKALPGMVKTFLRSLCAFYLSGIAYRVLRENKAFAVGTVRRVLLLTDIPGWSEFLISFALYALVVLVAFAGLKAMCRHPWTVLPLSLVCIACTFLPYDSITSPYLELLVGGRDFSYFPIVQYMPYFLCGIIYATGNTKRRLLMLPFAAASTVAALVWTMVQGGLPERFPPHWAWILLPALGVAGITALCHGLHQIHGRVGQYIVSSLTRGLGAIGTRSLYFLLGSNLVLFTMSGKGLVPSVARKSILPWTQSIMSPVGALCWTAVLVLALMFVARLAGRSAARPRNERS